MAVEEKPPIMNESRLVTVAGGILLKHRTHSSRRAIDLEILAARMRFKPRKSVEYIAAIHGAPGFKPRILHVIRTIDA
ncbi:hypothetical protein KM043_011955 [Ampulex compressa]|nr:hypothetical protein KM043_011955 [Ampulex compressa]